MAKQYHRSVFGRAKRGWRGMHQGYSRLEDLDNYVPSCVNLGEASYSLTQRAGAKRVECLDDEIHSALVLDGATLYSSGQKVYTFEYRTKREI